MSTEHTIDRPGVLLDYAHDARRHNGLRVLIAPAIVTSVVALVALAVYALTPARYRAVGYVQVGAVPGF